MACYCGNKFGIQSFYFRAALWAIKSRCNHYIIRCFSKWESFSSIMAFNRLFIALIDCFRRCRGRLLLSFSRRLIQHIRVNNLLYCSNMPQPTATNRDSYFFISRTSEHRTSYIRISSILGYSNSRKLFCLHLAGCLRS